jgi:hypothetical protein
MNVERFWAKVDHHKIIIDSSSYCKTIVVSIEKLLNKLLKKHGINICGPTFAKN